MQCSARTWHLCWIKVENLACPRKDYHLVTALKTCRSLNASSYSVQANRRIYPLPVPAKICILKGRNSRTMSCVEEIMKTCLVSVFLLISNGPALGEVVYDTEPEIFLSEFDPCAHLWKSFDKC